MSVFWAGLFVGLVIGVQVGAVAIAFWFHRKREH